MRGKARTGLTTVTFRRKSLQEIIGLAAAAGLNGLEIGGDVHVPPGDRQVAAAVRSQVAAAGLELFSYGSYYTAGESGEDDFADVLHTAVTLGAPRIRVWTARRGGADEQAEEVTVRALRSACRSAAREGIELGMEFHNGTVNDSAAQAIKLIERVGENNLFTYWQPLYGQAQNVADITALGAYCKHVHVYNWIYGEAGVTRLTLSDPYRDWAEYVHLLQDKIYIMEFVQNDDEKIFAADAAYLQKIIRENVYVKR